MEEFLVWQETRFCIEGDVSMNVKTYYGICRLGIKNTGRVPEINGLPTQHRIRRILALKKYFQVALFIRLQLCQILMFTVGSSKVNLKYTKLLENLLSALEDSITGHLKRMIFHF